MYKRKYWEYDIHLMSETQDLLYDNIQRELTDTTTSHTREEITALRLALQYLLNSTLLGIKNEDIFLEAKFGKYRVKVEYYSMANMVDLQIYHVETLTIK